MDEVVELLHKCVTIIRIRQGEQEITPEVLKLFGYENIDDAIHHTLMQVYTYLDDKHGIKKC